MKLLVIDDEPFNVEILEEILFDAGYQHVYSNTDSRQALDLCEQHQPDLLLLDLQMPHIDGLEILKQLKSSEKLRNIATLVVTAQTGQEYRMRALNYGAKDFITKPFNPSEVQTRVENLLETQRLHNNLRAQNKELQHVNNTMSELVSIVSHELRTPLTSIKSFVEILRDEDDNLDNDSKKQFLEIINNESDRLSRLISNLLDLQKISSGKMAWKTDLVDLVKVTHDTVEFFKPAFKDKGLSLVLTPEIYAGRAMIDADKIRQVLTNLLSNALKFTTTGGVTATVRHNNTWANIIILSRDQETSGKLVGLMNGILASAHRYTDQSETIEHLEYYGGSTDLLIIDISNSDPDNIVFLEQLRASYPALPIITIVSDENNASNRKSSVFEHSTSIKKPLDIEKSGNEIELQVSDMIGLNPQTTMIEISITDTGPGIPKKEQNKVFDRFHQVDTSHTREQGGTGLGLTICQEIVNHFYGRIWVESEVDQGSVFKIIIPEIHKKKKKLGELLVEKGLVTHEQLSDVLKDQE